MSAITQQQCRLFNSAGTVKHNKIIGFQTSDSGGVQHGCSSAPIARHFPNEQLFVEDLEQKSLSTSRQRSIKTVSNFTLKSVESVDSSLHSRLAEDVLARGDFVAYQGADLNKFFCEQRDPQHVSEVCLVNDHYILVKMPDAYWGRNSQMESIAEEVSSGAGSREQLTTERLAEIARLRNSRFRRYFCCKRNRRVVPMQTMCDEANGNCAKSSVRAKLKCSVGNCWRASKDEHEVYETRTKIRGKSNGGVNNAETINMATAEVLDLRVKRIKVQEAHNAKSFSEHCTDAFVREPIEMPSIYAPPPHHTALQTSLHETVQLQQHVLLATPLKMGHNAERSCIGEGNHKAIDSKKLKNRRLSAFHWLLKPFRPRVRKQKTKSKINAVVYKTYFVRWKKAPDELCHCCGKAKQKRTLPAGDATTLRRTRSASF